METFTTITAAIALELILGALTAAVFWDHIDQRSPDVSVDVFGCYVVGFFWPFTWLIVMVYALFRWMDSDQPWLGAYQPKEKQ